MWHISLENDFGVVLVYLILNLESVSVCKELNRIDGDESCLQLLQLNCQRSSGVLGGLEMTTTNAYLANRSSDLRNQWQLM